MNALVLGCLLYSLLTICARRLMASIECPSCGYENCLDDTTFDVVLETHAPFCRATQEGEDKKKWESQKHKMKHLYAGTERSKS
jgi:hypothetical protein